MAGRLQWRRSCSARPCVRGPAGRGQPGRRARQRANANLARALALEASVAPCPHRATIQSAATHALCGSRPSASGRVAFCGGLLAWAGVLAGQAVGRWLRFSLSWVFDWIFDAFLARVIITVASTLELKVVWVGLARTGRRAPNAASHQQMGRLEPGQVAPCRCLGGWRSRTETVQPGAKAVHCARSLLRGRGMRAGGLASPPSLPACCTLITWSTIF